MMPDLLFPPARMDDNRAPLGIAAAEPSRSKIPTAGIENYRPSNPEKLMKSQSVSVPAPLADIPRIMNGKERKRAKPSRAERLEYERIVFAQQFAEMEGRLRGVPQKPLTKEQKRLNTLPRKSGMIAARYKPDRCEVCETECKVVFDHCHAAEKFRGWLCASCNWALGQVKDNPKTLRALADYLEKFKPL